MADAPPRTRRPPPPFRHAAVTAVVPLGPRLSRVTLAGPALAGFPVPDPAGSLRLLLPSPGAAGLEIPTWTGNEFLLGDGQRPALRTLTPLEIDSAGGRLEVAVVRHPGGVAGRWVDQAGPGDPVAISGPGRGYAVDPGAPGFLLAGDETAIPAIGQLLAAIPPTTPVAVHVEIATPDGAVPLPEHPAATVAWHVSVPDQPVGTALFAAVAGAAWRPGTRIWAAGEAAAVQRLRRLLFDERGVDRAEATIRGYWKYGRAGGAE